MQVKCEFCGAWMEDTDEKCSQCGSANNHIKTQINEHPQTIAELTAWYEARKLPPMEVTRFFIGIDNREPRSFGIYRSGDSVTVYKNKADGSRAVRYSGPDEAYAVNELYMRIKQEILHQKENNTGSSQRPATMQRTLRSSAQEPMVPKAVEPGVPQTMSELKNWYDTLENKNEDLIKLRVGVDNRWPGTICVFEYRGYYTTCVTKADGTKYTAYSGDSEAEAASAAYKQYQAISSGNDMKALPASMQKKIEEKKQQKKKNQKLWLIILAATVLVAGFLAIVTIIKNGNIEYNRKVLPHINAYYGTEDTLWYYDQNGRWWRYDTELQDYVAEFQRAWPSNIESGHVDGTGYFPAGMNNEVCLVTTNVADLTKFGFLENDTQIVTEKYNIKHSHQYVDTTGHKTPKQGYYGYENTLYYYLPDLYSTDGQRQSGWFRQIGSSWLYWTDASDHAALGDDLWYAADDYEITKRKDPKTSADIYLWGNGDVWQNDDDQFTFEQTTAFKNFETSHEKYTQRKEREAEEAAERRRKEQEERESSDYWKDKDNDYDWDSNNYNWDNNTTDWGSDW